MNEQALQIEGIFKQYEQTVVLRGIDARVGRGAMTAFIGPNGAGKTTLFHTISGDMHPDRGSVKLNGRAITSWPPWKIARLGLGKMFQDARIFENLTVLENVIVALQPHREQSALRALTGLRTRAKQDAQEREEALRYLQIVGVEPPFDRRGSVLSFGNKKLLALARLLAGRFNVLLLDEPTSGLSPEAAQRIGGLLRSRIVENGLTVAVIEHNYSFVMEFADFTFVLHDGALLDSGASREVLDRTHNREILIGL